MARLLGAQCMTLLCQRHAGNMLQFLCQHLLCLDTERIAKQCPGSGDMHKSGWSTAPPSTTFLLTSDRLPPQQQPTPIPPPSRCFTVCIPQQPNPHIFNTCRVISLWALSALHCYREDIISPGPVLPYSHLELQSLIIHAGDQCGVVAGDGGNNAAVGLLT